MKMKMTYPRVAMTELPNTHSARKLASSRTDGVASLATSPLTPSLLISLLKTFLRMSFPVSIPHMESPCPFSFMSIIPSRRAVDAAYTSCASAAVFTRLWRLDIVIDVDAVASESVARHVLSPLLVLLPAA